MLAAVDLEKTKEVTISYLSLKSTVLGWILMNSLNPSNCTPRQLQLHLLFLLFYKLGFFFDLVTLVYFYLDHKFSRLQFYVFYFLHVLSAFMMLILVELVRAQDLAEEPFCSAFHQVKYACLILNFSFVASSLLVVVLQLLTALRFVHFGGNLVWTFLYFAGYPNVHLGVTIIGAYHLLSLLMAVVGLPLVWAIGKSVTSSRIWNILSTGNMIGLFLCYLIAVLANMDKTKDYQEMYIRSYVRFGIVEMLSPLMYLLFIRRDEGDPREQYVSNYRHVFQEMWENQQFCKR